MGTFDLSSRCFILSGFAITVKISRKMENTLSKREGQGDIWKSSPNHLVRTTSLISGMRVSSTNFGKPISFSMTSEDIHRMVKIKELLYQEKEMKSEIRKKEISFLETLKNDAKKNNFSECLCKSEKSKVDVGKVKVKDNKRLMDYLVELKTEIRKCIERIEGPITEQLLVEKRKSNLLRKQVESTREMEIRSQGCETELNNCLEEVLKNINALTEINLKLKEDVSDMESKYKELQDLLNEHQSYNSAMVQQLSQAAIRKFASTV